jgi:6-phosphofructokinase 1
MQKNLLITMSGGTTSVINATLTGIITAAETVGSIDRILAGYPGMKGTLEESIVDLTGLTDNDLERLYYTPASGFIGTTRIRPMGEEELTRLVEVFSAHNIGFFINIGGNGTVQQSMQISGALSSEVKVAAVPKTVDNDLGDGEFERVLYTPGFPSCANYWRRKTWIMNQENLGAHSHDKVLIAQTFGRKTGFLAGCARLGDIDREMPLVILLPEDQKPLGEVMDHIEDVVREYDRAIVVLSEGYDVGDIGERFDLRGQVMYGTSKTTAAQLLVNHCAEMGIQARGFVPGFDQRSDITFVSGLDLEMAYGVGRRAVERLHAGQTDFLSSISKSLSRAKSDRCTIL